VSLPYLVLNLDRHAAVLTTVREELLTPLGLRSLSPRDPRYQGRYGGAVAARDRAYHQGTTYPWLLGPFISAFVRVYGRSQPTREQARGMLKACLDRACGPQAGGQIHELFDGDAPQHPGGLTASARSVAEVLRAYAEDVLDLGPVDVARQSGNGNGHLPSGVSEPARTT
jgi:glycogen debranching enzyme